MIQKTLKGSEYKWDPLVSLYYYAPVCGITSFCAALVYEVPHFHLADVYKVGFGTLLANALVAFTFNVSEVMLVSDSLHQLNSSTNNERSTKHQA